MGAVSCEKGTRIVRHLRVSFEKRGVWADVIHGKRICRDAVVSIERKPGSWARMRLDPGDCAGFPGAWRLPKWPVVNELSRTLCRVWGSLVKVSLCF